MEGGDALRRERKDALDALRSSRAWRALIAHAQEDKDGCIKSLVGCKLDTQTDILKASNLQNRVKVLNEVFGLDENASFLDVLIAEL